MFPCNAVQTNKQTNAPLTHRANVFIFTHCVQLSTMDLEIKHKEYGQLQVSQRVYFATQESTKHSLEICAKMLLLINRLRRYKRTEVHVRIKCDWVSCETACTFFDKYKLFDNSIITTRKCNQKENRIVFTVYTKFSKIDCNTNQIQ